MMMRKKKLAQKRLIRVSPVAGLRWLSLQKLKKRQRLFVKQKWNGWQLKMRNVRREAACQNETSTQ